MPKLWTISGYRYTMMHDNYDPDEDTKSFEIKKGTPTEVGLYVLYYSDFLTENRFVAMAYFNDKMDMFDSTGACCTLLFKEKGFRITSYIGPVPMK